MPRQHPKRFDYQTSTRPRKRVNSNSTLKFLNGYTIVVARRWSLGGSNVQGHCL